ncbi:MAG: restriction endonuclease [Planctomycetaceae bacterium]|nr:restriction endonuclease [Planctomycetaceae bacterium]
MDASYHYPPDVFNLLVDTIPKLNKSKRDVLIFFRGAGVSESTMEDLTHRVNTDKDSIDKYEIARTIIKRINEIGDPAIRLRRELIKRVVEYEDYSTCWPNDQLKAKGLVGELRRVIDVKDSFTRMSQEREHERKLRQSAEEAKTSERIFKSQQIEELKSDLFALFSQNDQPQKRGKSLESVLNALFAVYEVLVKGDFKRIDPEGAGIIEQVDGVIEFSGSTYLVEMKWVKEPIGVDNISQHLVRIFNRPDTRGIFIASNGYTKPAITTCREALGQKTIVLVSLQEIVMLLERQGCLVKFLQEKIRAATLNKNPYLEILN